MGHIEIVRLRARCARLLAQGALRHLLAGGDQVEIVGDANDLQPIEDQSSAATVTAISAVPAHPKKVSVGRALKRPITERRVTTTIMTAMIGTATMPLSTALQISIWMGSIGV